MAETNPSRAALRERLAAMRAELIEALAAENAVDADMLALLANVGAVLRGA